jgi:hypothetical protein
MSRLSPKCASRTKSTRQSEFAADASAASLRVRPICRMVERSDVNQLLPGTVMGFASAFARRATADKSLYPSYEMCDFCRCWRHRESRRRNQNCCSVKTVMAIPARSRSSTLCESSMPAPTLTAVRILRHCRYPSRANKHGYGRVAYLQVNSRKGASKKTACTNVGMNPALVERS